MLRLAAELTPFAIIAEGSDHDAFAMNCVVTAAKIDVTSGAEWTGLIAKAVATYVPIDEIRPPNVRVRTGLPAGANEIRNLGPK